MNDNRLPQSSWDDVKLTAEGLKDIAVDQATDRIEPIRFPDEGNTSSDDDSAGREQSNDLCEGEGDCPPGTIQDRLRVEIAVSSGLGDQGRGDPAR